MTGCGSHATPPPLDRTMRSVSFFQALTAVTLSGHQTRTVGAEHAQTGRQARQGQSGETRAEKAPPMMASRHGATFPRLVVLAAWIALMLGVTACETMGSAKMIKRSRAGGVIALEGDRTKAMKAARKQMEKACNGPYVVVEESTEVVGTDVESKRGTHHYDSRGRWVERERLESREVRETRLTYECGEGESPGITVDSPDDEEEADHEPRRANVPQKKNAREPTLPLDEEPAPAPPQADAPAPAPQPLQDARPMPPRNRNSAPAPRAAEPDADLFEGTSSPRVLNQFTLAAALLSSGTCGACLSATLFAGACATGTGCGALFADDKSFWVPLAGATLLGALVHMVVLMVGTVVTGALHYLVIRGTTLVPARPKPVKAQTPDPSPPIPAEEQPSSVEMPRSTAPQADPPNY